MSKGIALTNGLAKDFAALAAEGICCVPLYCNVKGISVLFLEIKKSKHTHRSLHYVRLNN